VPGYHSTGSGGRGSMRTRAEVAAEDPRPLE